MHGRNWPSLFYLCLRLSPKALRRPLAGPVFVSVQLLAHLVGRTTPMHQDKCSASQTRVCLHLSCRYSMRRLPACLQESSRHCYRYVHGQGSPPDMRYTCPSKYSYFASGLARSSSRHSSTVMYRGSLGAAISHLLVKSIANEGFLLLVQFVSRIS